MGQKNYKNNNYKKNNNTNHTNYQRREYQNRSKNNYQKYDKRALYEVSKALGHNRLRVVVENYLS